MKSFSIFVIACIALIGVYFLLFMHKDFSSGNLAPTTLIHIGATAIKAEVVSTEASREQGLSGRTSLQEGEGMLFVFDEENNWGIWMKDMHFPIDILWAKKDGTITTITHDVATSTYPTIFYPNTPDAFFVLEIPAGYAQTQGIAEGMKIVL